MWIYPEKYDVIVIGAGHAGCEAAFICAKKGVKTLLLTTNLDTIAKLSCNPSIGGVGKGHIVREIDALGGIMATIADTTAIHYKMLNASKGPAVQAPRAQIDRMAYQITMKSRLEKTQNLEIKQGTIDSFIIEENQAKGVSTLEGVTYKAKTVILCSGTFLQGTIFMGEVSFSGGRNGDKAVNTLSNNLKKLGFDLQKLKTGTPPRIHKKSICFDKVEKQPGDKNIRFSFEKTKSTLPQTLCYITYTTEQTKQIIKDNIYKSALFSGKIKGVGPRYCPSIEDKITRFEHKERHQVFLEPEGLNTEEFYINGMSTSMPADVQLAFIRSIKGLEKAEIMRPAYAIEYDYVAGGQIYSTLETKHISNLFFAGQINGTTGYEEAAAQGLIAGINAANKALNKDSFLLKRSDSYIGVLIDDLVSKKITEPYRMFTSRAEHRLLLRQDNADLRLFMCAYEQKLISKKQYDLLKEKKEIVEKEKEKLANTHINQNNKKLSLKQILSRPEYTYEKLKENFSDKVNSYSKEINKQIEIETKYAGYITRQKREIEKFKHLEKILIPRNFSFEKISGLRNEAQEKLKKILPPNLLAASRLSGIYPADISILMIALKKKP